MQADYVNGAFAGAHVFAMRFAFLHSGRYTLISQQPILPTSDFIACQYLTLRADSASQMCPWMINFQ